MWDVKELAKRVFSLTVKFYLNYVGCKETLMGVFYIELESFTLTMWDVKAATSS